jgi:hypothetical protein
MTDKYKLIGFIVVKVLKPCICKMKGACICLRGIINIYYEMPFSSSPPPHSSLLSSPSSTSSSSSLFHLFIYSFEKILQKTLFILTLSGKFSEFCTVAIIVNCFIQDLYVFMIYLHTKFQILHSNGSLRDKCRLFSSHNVFVLHPTKKLLDIANSFSKIYYCTSLQGHVLSDANTVATS